MRRPRFIAEQSRHASGPLGRVIAWIMARETWRENLGAIDALEIAPADHVLDVGSGHGRSLTVLAERAACGRVVGADPSPLMCTIAAKRTRAHVRAGRVALECASAEKLPFADASFDKILCVHVAYFWSDLAAALRELARVTKPGGRVALVARTSANPGATASFPAEIYRFPTSRELLCAVASAGFAPELRGDRDETREALLMLAVRSGS